jgi:uncharacterized protein (TIGR00369 family)
VTPAAAQAILAENFAPWVQALGLTVETVAADAAILRLPFDPRLVRIGGTVCGQALMTAADTAMVVACSAALGGFRPMATVGQTISFLRPVANDNVLVEASGHLIDGRGIVVHEEAKRAHEILEMVVVLLGSRVHAVRRR